MRKRIIITLVSACAILSLVACGEPQVSIEPVYKDLVIEEPELQTVTDSAIDEEIEYLLNLYTDYSDVTDRGILIDDIVVFDYCGRIDGQIFDGGEGTDFEVTIGSGDFVYDVEIEMISAHAGDILEIPVTFPDYYEGELAGADVVFTISITSVQSLITPELSTEIIQSVSETSTTEEEFREEIAGWLEEYYLETYESDKEAAVLTAVMESVVVEEYPESVINDYTEKYIASYEAQASYYGLTLEELISAYGLEEADFYLYMDEMAEQTYLLNLVTDYILDAEAIEITDELYDEAVQKIVESYDYESVETLYEYVDEDDIETEVRTEIVVSWLMENSTFVKSAE